jgi:hypothetical protein
LVIAVRLFAALLLLIPGATAFAHPSVSVVIDSHGAVYYSDLHDVWRLSPDGTRSIVVPRVHSHELVLDSADNLYGEHLWYEGDATKKWGHRVWRRSPDGRIVDVIPATEGFLSHYSFVRDARGAMYWAERGTSTTIRRRTPDGVEHDIATGPFTDVRWMAATPDGTIFLIDDGRLVRIGPDGVTREIVHDLTSRSLSRLLVERRHSVMGLYADERGYVYVAQYGAGRVVRVDDGGHVTTVATSSMPWSPSGMAVRNGALYVLEFSVDNRARLRTLPLR